LLALAGCSRGPSYQDLAAGETVLAFGDSVTYGTGAGPGADYPTLLAEQTGWRVINAGIPGDTARQARDRIDSALAEYRPALVIVELGGNDFLRKHPQDQIREDLRYILRTAAESGAATALVAVPRLSLLRATTGTLSDAALYEDIAEEEGAILIADVFSQVLSDDTLRADPIHPNARGYEELTSGIVAALRAAGLLL
jgi:acyl-CoA hydrolase